jgi:eukaryotic-like serine/threonine-protein kinase
MLGAAPLGQMKYAEAEPRLLKGYEGMKQREKAIPAWDLNHVSRSLDLLIQLYTATNKPEELKKWQAERAKYPESKLAEKK